MILFLERLGCCSGEGVSPWKSRGARFAAAFLAAAGIGEVVMRLTSMADTQDVPWIIISSIIVQEVTVEESLVKGFARAVGTVLGAGVGWFFALCTKSVPTYTQTVHTFVYLCGYLLTALAIYFWFAVGHMWSVNSRFPYAHILAGVTMALGFYVELNGSSNFAMRRIWSICWGVLVGIAVSILIFPKTAYQGMCEVLNQGLELTRKSTEGLVERARESNDSSFVSYHHTTDEVLAKVGELLVLLYGKGEGLLKIATYGSQVQAEAFNQVYRYIRRIAVVCAIMGPYLLHPDNGLINGHASSIFLQVTQLLDCMIEARSRRGPCKRADIGLLKEIVLKIKEDHARFIASSLKDIIEDLLKSQKFASTLTGRERNAESEEQPSSPTADLLIILNRTHCARTPLSTLSLVELITRLIMRVDDLIESLEVLEQAECPDGERIDKSGERGESKEEEAVAHSPRRGDDGFSIPNFSFSSPSSSSSGRRKKCIK